MTQSKVRPASLTALVFVLAFGADVSADDPEPNGRELAFSTAKGNCLACHMIPGDAGALTSANIGPPLLAMRERFPDRERLRARKSGTRPSSIPIRSCRRSASTRS
jgi:L-cysteine S-thiosulfotransferase